MRYLVRAAALAAVVVAATACSGESDGEAQPQPSSPAASTEPAAPSSAANSGQEVPHSGAPAVETPLPKSVLNGDPCADALTNEQAKKLLGEAVRSEDDDEPRMGPGCYWSNQETMASFGLNYDIADGQGLSGAYANAKPKVDRFAEVEPIGGFPAVQYSEGDEDRVCSTVIGLADNYGLVMSLAVGTKGAEEGDDPCQASRQVLDRIVSNLKPKA